jgi:hypothetical protein
MRAAARLLPLAALLLSGPAFAGSDGARAELDSFLAVPTDQRLAAALGAKDHRYLAVAGAALEAPGAPPYWIERGRHRIIPGTLELLGAGQDAALAERALDYARDYNEGLQRELDRADP